MEIGDRRFQDFVSLIVSPDRRNGPVDTDGWARAAAQRTGFAGHLVAKQMERQHTDRTPGRARATRALKKILLVEPEADGLLAALNSVRTVANVQACRDFQAARARLLSRPPDLLVTNIRLQAFNGLHLVHLAAGTNTRCIAYSSHDDLMLAREVQAVGAFYEQSRRLPQALAAYAQAVLPPRDRRIPGSDDRRNGFRGGRRSTDQSIEASA